MSSTTSIMVVEDEKDILQILELYLIKWGFAVEPFDDARKALRAFGKSPQAFSLVLSDVRMPAMDGISFAKEILGLNPDAKIVMMTAFEMDEMICENLHHIKKEDILRKPFKLTDVCAAVKKQLAIH